jgi:hypothetical protein
MVVFDEFGNGLFEEPSCFSELVLLSIKGMVRVPVGFECDGPRCSGGAGRSWSMSFRVVDWGNVVNSCLDPSGRYSQPPSAHVWTNGVRGSFTLSPDPLRTEEQRLADEAGQTRKLLPTGLWLVSDPGAFERVSGAVSVWLDRGYYEPV